MMSRGYLEELWLFTVGRENLRKDTAVFKYLKFPIKEELKVFSLKLENKSKKWEEGVGRQIFYFV